MGTGSKFWLIFSFLWAFMANGASFLSARSYRLTLRQSPRSHCSGKRYRPSTSGLWQVRRVINPETISFVASRFKVSAPFVVSHTFLSSGANQETNPSGMPTFTGLSPPVCAGCRSAISIGSSSTYPLPFCGLQNRAFERRLSCPAMGKLALIFGPGSVRPRHRRSFLATPKTNLPREVGRSELEYTLQHVNVDEPWRLI
jgi:hypothetical protein